MCHRVVVSSSTETAGTVTTRSSLSVAMEHPPLSSDWELLGEAYYRRSEVYSLQWPIKDLSDYIVAGAAAGGPIAIMRDESKPMLLGKHATGKPKISIYSSSGGSIETIIWEHTSKPIKFGFNRAEDLVVITQEGQYRVYPLTSSSASSSLGYASYSLGAEASETGVLDARIAEDACVVLLGSLNFIEVKDESGRSASSTSEGSPISVSRLAESGLSEGPQAWTTIPADVSPRRQLEVVFATTAGVKILDSLDCQDQSMRLGSVQAMAASPNGSFIALVASSPDLPGRIVLSVLSSDFSRSLSECDLATQGVAGEPDQVAWCGSNSVLLAYGELVIMVGPFGESLKFSFDRSPVLISELDGTRVISATTCDFISKISDTTLQTFRPGSAAPSAILVDASEQFERKSPRSDEIIRSIRSDLTSAVDTCIDAAGRELDVYWQRKLLRAASYGKTYLDLYDSSDFVDMAQHLRVLNAVRYYEIGIPITYEQFKRSDPAHLVARLTARSHHLLAMRIATFLSLSTAPVLQHWASSKVAAAKGRNEDDEVTGLIVDRLKGQSELSCADVALTAWKSGQTKLAAKLLEHEVRASKQVPLLMSMREDDLALVKAIASGDTDLVFVVFAHLKKAHSLGQFFRIIEKKPAAAALLRAWCKDEDIELLRDYYYQDDRRVDAACLALHESTRITDFAEKMAKVRSGSKSFAEDKERSFETRMTEDYLRLLAYQQALEKEADDRKTFQGLSIDGTIRACILCSWPKKADKIKSEFEVPDIRFWFIKIKALIEARDWDSLEAFSRSKRSPIGYEPFVELLVASGHKRQAVTFVQRCEMRNRIELYVRCDEWLRAGQECKDRSDRGRLMDLRQRAPNATIAAQLEKMLDELNS
ncbi:uncharacterized protein L969DRAFT_84183 [Mixia osmundae IAM 14324]|uniref:Probable vacuolar protein sorting-associated protein 16 homolog n=1 Tax=Mixia osmundae (strain CBS 9802 / IAM 14324 / JCM 22182 / KY 12970) TaxID=764103 RepID=G7EAH4_MIXOS|nr:uncharacterized protein L969DRAFT_84183 [Mixia osmundae IAM 14324]KEI42324.1 hypothetical protein L969DRAFT_84183 [Mixia osmundae IAM 14324]GAA99834.1 hypothetical protein E5Q_06537 [Mixia osmundae IAM 14324]